MIRTLTLPALAAFAVAAGVVSAQEASSSIPQPARGGAVRVEPERSSMLLGADTEIRVEVRSPDGSDARAARLLAQHGSVHEIAFDEAAGVTTAVYRPPEVFVPRVDVLAALVETDDGPRWGFAALQLVGQGQAVLKTKPLAEAIIRIGDRTFGPVRSDRKGKSVIRVEVPPGTSSGIDGEGGEVDLGVPPVARTAVFFDRARIAQGAPDGAELLIVVLREDGTVDEDTAPSVVADRGSVSTPARIEPGMFTARFTPDDAEPGEAEITASIAGEDRPVAIAKIEISPRPIESLPPEDVPVEPDPAPLAPALRPWMNAALSAGFAWNLGSMKTFAVGAELGVRMPAPADSLFLHVLASMSRASWDGSAPIAAGAAATEAVTWLVPICGAVTYRFETEGRFAFPLRVQAGAILLDNEIEMKPAGAPAVTERERVYLFAVGGGIAAELTVGTGAFFIAVEYLGALGAVETIEGSLSTMRASAGYRLFFL